MKTSNQDNEIETDTKLFQLGWSCAQTEMANFYKDHYSNISLRISGLSLFGTSFKPDKYTATLRDGLKTSCKAEYEMQKSNTSQGKTPKYKVSTEYTYLGVKLFDSNLRLVLTPSISVFISQNKDQQWVLTGELETAYTLTYEDFICQHKVSYKDYVGSNYTDSPYTIPYENCTEDFVISFFSSNLNETISRALNELERSFEGLEEELERKKVYRRPNQKMPINLDTLLKILARDKNFEEQSLYN